MTSRFASRRIKRARRERGGAAHARTRATRDADCGVSGSCRKARLGRAGAGYYSRGNFFASSRAEPIVLRPRPPTLAPIPFQAE